MTPEERLADYREQLRRPFHKLCRLRFLNPDGSTAFALDNLPGNDRSRTFLQEGTLNVNLQNGQRRQATVTLANVNGEYDYNVNNLWFGTEIALDEGLALSDGTPYYIQQGVFLVAEPEERVEPGKRTVTLNLVDKWAGLDGSLFGKLEADYEVPVNTPIFPAIASVLNLEKGNGFRVDMTPPTFTPYYNGKTQTLPDGTIVTVTDTPYTMRTEGGGSYADIILELCGMLNAWVGYDSTGTLRVDPSQDDISDGDKPVLWRFTPKEANLLGLTYSVKNKDVYNDIIVVGEMMDDSQQPAARAMNLDPRSDTNVQTIGRKTLRHEAAGYATVVQCRDYAEWKLKRATVLQRAVTISCTQMFHIEENNLVEVARTDKPGSPVEKHLIQGFSRPLATDGAMTINAVSVNDFVDATIVIWPPTT